MTVEPKYCEVAGCGRLFLRHAGSSVRECSAHDTTYTPVPVRKPTPDGQWAKIAELIH